MKLTRLLMRWMEYYGISDLWKKGFYLGFLLATLPFICLVSCTSFEHLTTSGDGFAHAEDCSECHITVYNEWSQSDHAKAYVNPYFRKATNDYAFENCIGCHAPKPEVTDETPTARATGREDGVTCVSCHLKEGKMVGSITPTGIAKPHPIEVDKELFRSNAICGGCHEGTQQEWKSVEGEKKTCQQCHMPPVKRKVTQAAGGISNIIVAFEKKRMLGRHDFSMPMDYIPDKIISVTGKRNDSSLTVKIKNNLPHNLPTGDFGYRVLELQAFATNKLDQEIEVGRRELVPELSSAIPPRGVLTWNIEIPSDAVRASIILKRQSYKETDIIVLANVEISF